MELLHSFLGVDFFQLSKDDFIEGRAGLESEGELNKLKMCLGHAGSRVESSSDAAVQCCTASQQYC